MSNTVQATSRILWHYRLYLADGHLVEASEDPDGDMLQLGQSDIHPNLEAALIGLPQGEKTRLIIMADQAFGYPDPDAIQTVPRTDFPASMTLVVGQIIGFTLPSGQEIPGKILAIHADTVQVDFNHPLAGHHLSFELEILDIL
ncbi:FKBP-type peptidyl-prolyl cis-trans isomerase [Thiothrix fructosivorans]|uniref:Peptidyl-prolyl cis-trans isomerase n=1 Tax=Thiothrix fructosivorans TaxID=111770 RepID=A0A8B0SKH7_9GAMM|nr:FKBP-type peptidyl-prolyl cis-trans isomerase [Thiothrix fructosivorans]MBO0613028.1 FKBP-type peptidyl-prolyl cis-trans isomerase [Thiothrix fructosivorans]QTX11525.1 FKBP-type peptidyl-prolyl cis-trans isomerase [Thiothrix fructosivorans]